MSLVENAGLPQLLCITIDRDCNRAHVSQLISIYVLVGDLISRRYGLRWDLALP